MDRTVALVAGAVLAALSVVGCGGLNRAPGTAPVTRDSVAAPAEIRRLHDRDIRAVLTGDTTTLMSLRTDDIVAMAPGRPITHEHFREHLDVAEIARVAGVSAEHLSRTFSRFRGLRSPSMLADFALRGRRKQSFGTSGRSPRLRPPPGISTRAISHASFVGGWGQRRPSTGG
jgi:hypothetical protein